MSTRFAPIVAEGAFDLDEGIAMKPELKELLDTASRHERCLFKFIATVAKNQAEILRSITVGTDQEIEGAHYVDQIEAQNQEIIDYLPDVPPN